MQCTISASNDQAHVTLKERLIYSDTAEFASVLEQVRQHGMPSCIVDLQELDHIDSSGLRMLLLLHDACRDLGAHMIFKTKDGQVRTMLMHSRFDTIVAIDP